MKKRWIKLLTAVLAISLLTACGGEDNAEATPTPAPTDSVADPNAGVTDPNAGVTDPNAGVTDPNAGVTDPNANIPVTNVERVVLKDYPVENYVTLGEYKGIQVTIPGKEVSQGEWDSLVAQVYSDFVTVEDGIKDRAVEMGDLINLDYSGKKDGVVFDGGTATNQQLGIGSGSFIDGFEEGLVGVMPGETVDLNLTFPEAYHSADLAGKEVVFTVTVNYIYPGEETWSDDVVAAAGNADFSTVEELKQYVYDYLKDYKEYYYDINLENAVVEAFMNQCQFTGTATELMESYQNDFILTMQNEAAMYGMDVDSLCSYYYGVDLQTFLMLYVGESVNQSLAFQAVANAENLNLSDEEFDARLAELATEYGCTVEEYIGANPKEGYRELFMLEDVVAFLVENAIVNAE